jgi:alpha-tubulin suppressor-like RCC1 family protein
MHTRRTLLTLGALALIAVGAALLLSSAAGPASAAGDVTAVDTGGSHICALTSESTVKCWGTNTYGQLGDGTTTGRDAPVDVCATGTAPPCTPASDNVLSGVTAIAVGGEHTCALLDAGGALKCWGRNNVGQLGDGTTATRTTPVDVSNLGSGVAAISAGSAYTCALTSAGGVKCWGRNNQGQLGDGTTTDRDEPADVPGLTSGVAAVAAGTSHTCAITTAGGLKCWGLNSQGQLGDGTNTGRTTPVDASGLSSGVTAVAPGNFHTCAVVEGGVKCWGFNNYGQLGDGTTTRRFTPVIDVLGLTSGVAAVAAGGSHSCALTSAGAVKCWGRNRTGQLGDGTSTGRLSPVDASGLTSGVDAIAARGNRTCAVTTDGGVTCWGSGQLTPLEVLGLKPTPTPTVTPTATPPAEDLLGDVNCVSGVNTIDAALILQLDAGLIGSVICLQNGDVNGDGSINSLDALLILQFDAGLIGSLPP